MHKATGYFAGSRNSARAAARIARCNRSCNFVVDNSVDNPLDSSADNSPDFVAVRRRLIESFSPALPVLTAAFEAARNCSCNRLSFVEKRNQVVFVDL